MLPAGLWQGPTVFNNFELCWLCFIPGQVAGVSSCKARFDYDVKRVMQLKDRPVVGEAAVKSAGEAEKLRASQTLFHFGVKISVRCSIIFINLGVCLDNSWTFPRWDWWDMSILCCQKTHINCACDFSTLFGILACLGTPSDIGPGLKRCCTTQNGRIWGFGSF